MKIFAIIPKNFNLSKKLTTLMLAIFLSGIIVSGVVYYNILLGNAENEVNTQANLLISTVDAIRKYNAERVTPLLEKQSEEKMLIEAIPSVAMVKVFDIFTNAIQDKYGEYSYRNAMINPTNIKDKADENEIKIIEKLSQQYKPGGKNIAEGYRTMNGENNRYFYTARPIIIQQKQTSCLSCHTSLEKSPKSLQALYKQGVYTGNNGFGWELDKVIGTKIIYVPADKVDKIAKQNFLIILGTFMAIFAISISLVNLWLKQHIVRPLNQITQVAEAVSLGDMDANFENEYKDEIGRLADAFRRVKTTLEISIKRPRS
jgi:methyl-accepting chemotaxis protein